MSVVVANPTVDISGFALGRIMPQNITSEAVGRITFCAHSLAKWPVLPQEKQAPSTTLTSNLNGAIFGILCEYWITTSLKPTKENGLGIWYVTIKSDNILLCTPFTTASSDD